MGSTSHGQQAARSESSRSGGQGQRGGAQSDSGSESREFWLGLARGFGGAVLFSIPMLMTMEMWWLGFYALRWRLALLVVLLVPLLTGLSRFAGIRPTPSWLQDVLDAVTAYAIGLAAAAVTLALLGIYSLDTDFREIAGMVALEAVPASFGAMLAQSQLGGSGEKKREKHRKQKSGYAGEMFFMVAGAIYLCLAVAPTIEMIKIPFKMTPGHAAALAVVSIAAMHAFVYALKFKGAEPAPPGTPWWSLLVRFTLPGYVIALAVSAYLLWTFGRFESGSPHWMVMYSIVLGFPAAIGAASGRLVL